MRLVFTVMTHSDAGVDATVIAQIHQLYGRQSHLIDGGAAGEWAQTFTPDGEFISPSYPAPVVGSAELTVFAEKFTAAAAAAGELHRHVITNLDVTPGADDTVHVRAYLQIVATTAGGRSRLVRFTTITDRLVRHEHTWRIARRTVHRDDT